MSEPARGMDGIGPSHWPPELDNEYELVGELGRGGMAVVFRARDRELRRDVAIKVVRPHFSADEEAVARLAREARTVAQLEHPNIVGVYAIRHLPDRSVALVMQLIPGLTLKAALAEGPFDPERAERVLRDVARALAFAHRAGIVHRDVKPENIFLDDVSGRAMLSDFGVARAMDASTELTATGTTIGTPTYMAPEQIDGLQLDGRSDLYSLGMVGWEMLTGERPWAGENLYSVIYRQKHDPLPPVDLFREDVPPRLQYLVEGLLQKNPDRRWSSAARFLALLASDQALPGFRDWQATQKRRRRSRAFQEVRRRMESGEQASLETQRFSRSLTPGGTKVSTPSGGSADAEAEHDFNAPYADEPPERLSPAPAGYSVITIPPKRSHKGLWLTLAFLLVAGGAGGAAWWRYQQVQQEEQLRLLARLQDRAAVEVPVLPPAVTTDSAQQAAGIVATPPDSHVVAAGTDTVSAPPASPTRTGPPRVAAAGDSARGAAGAGAPASPPAAPRRTAAADSGLRTGRGAAVTTPGSVADSTTTAAIPVDLPPVPALNFPSVRGTVSAGGRHSCALVDGGRAVCWGSNDRGQLGDGSFVSHAGPTPVAGEFAFTQVSAGVNFTCGVTATDQVYCWGDNDAGELGDGTTSARAAPVRVNSGAAFRVVRTGQAHTCALSRSGTVLCWGANTFGQLGDGSNTSRSSPVSVQLPAPAAAIATGWYHSCAILTDGRAFCWGQNTAGQLGDGTASDHATPVAVLEDAPLVSIAAGSGHTCAVSAAGVAFCWGRNNWGQLGTGGNAARLTPNPVDGEASFATVVAGSVHTCARDAAGHAWCWGRNAYGQLGDGTTTDRDRPVAVRNVATFSALYAGGGHTCGRAATGDVFCWGFNIDGQLGSGDRENAALPSRVAIAPR